MPSSYPPDKSHRTRAASLPGVLAEVCRGWTCLMLLAGWLGLCSTVHAQDNARLPIVAVLDFETNTLKQSEADAFSQAVWSEFSHDALTRVWERRWVRQFLLSRDLYPGRPYGRPIALSEVAEATNSDYVVSGSVDQVGNSNVVHYALYSARLGSTFLKDTHYGRGTIEDLFHSIPEIISALIEQMKDVESGAYQAASNARRREIEDIAAARARDRERAEQAERSRAQSRARDEAAREAREAEKNSDDRLKIREAAPAAEAPPAGIPQPLPRTVTRTSEPEPSPEPPPSHIDPPLDEPEPPRTEIAAAQIAEHADAAPDPATETVEIVTPAPPEVHEPEPAQAEPEVQTIAPVTAHEAEPEIAEVAFIETPAESPAETAAPAETAHDESPMTEVAAGIAEDADSDQPTETSEDEAETPTSEPASSESDKLREISEASQRSAREAYDKAIAPGVEPAETIDLLRRAISLDPKPAAYHLQLAITFYRQGNYNECVRTCLQATEFIPDNSMLHTVLGSAHFASDQLDEAREAHRRAVELDSRNLYARFNYALVLTAQNSPKADEAWETFLELSMDVPEQAGNRRDATAFLNDVRDQGRFEVALQLHTDGAPGAQAAWEEYLRLSEGNAGQDRNRQRARTYLNELLGN